MKTYTRYLEVKEQYPDTIIFVRVGDFYEAFDADAVTVSEESSLVLASVPVGEGETRRRVKMCGMPYFAVESYIRTLTNRGYYVGLVDELEKGGQREGPDEDAPMPDEPGLPVLE